MAGILFMLGTVVVEGGLVFILMYLFAQGERRARAGEAERVRKELAAAAPRELRRAA
ncbi:MAG: hypothetical protein Q8P22_06930 [Chloroflexota bacterium]|nr:hypothetical protein [Chloroflexota bacterium]